MRLSANLGLPIAEPDDARRDYPLQVDAPRTDALDALWPLTGVTPTGVDLLPGELWDGPYVTFPVGRFTAAPSAQCTAKAFGPPVLISVNYTTPEGFQTSMFNPHAGFTATDLDQHWTASPVSPGAVLLDNVVPEMAFRGSCATADCGNNGAEVHAAAAPISGGPPRMVCGVCGAPMAVLGLA